MLEQLLNEIQMGGTRDANSLASRLGTTPQMVTAMLEHLERLGRLQDLQRCASQGCRGCSEAATCALPGISGRVWQVSKEKRKT
jgi:hypothetical protein